MTAKVGKNWQVSEDLFNDLHPDSDNGNSSFGFPVEKIEVVECPDEFVKTNMGIKIGKDDKGFQPINMKNPISGMSISGDEGKTWRAMAQFGETDFFLRPPEMSTGINHTIRVESWVGGSNVLFTSGPGSMWTPKASDRGNNICRGILSFNQV